MTNFMDSIFSDGTESTISVWSFLLCIGVSLLLGIVLALSYSFKNESSKSFKTSIAFLPSVVCVVIMMVNGNIGIGVAIAGAFSLVRFRSAQGTAKEICAIFMAMCSGLIAGVGYLFYASLFTVIMCLLTLTSNYISLKLEKKEMNKILKISIPEDLDYSEVFDDIFQEFTEKNELLQVKTAIMGSIYKLTYKVKFKHTIDEKKFIDKLRVRNGNMEISILREVKGNEL